MKKILILLILLISFSTVVSIPEEDEPTPLNPLEHPEDMPYRWCVKPEKNSFLRQIFKTFLEVKNYMRSKDLAYVYIQDCFVDDLMIDSKYRRLTRIWKKDNIHGNKYDHTITNTKN